MKRHEGSLAPWEGWLRVRGKVKGSDGKGCHTCCCFLNFLSLKTFSLHVLSLFCLRKRIRSCVSRIVYVARILILKFSLSMNLITEIFRLTYLFCFGEFQIHHSVPDMDGVVGPIISFSWIQSKCLHIAHHSPRMKRFFIREISFFLFHGELNLWIIGEGSFHHCDLNCQFSLTWEA